jgi:hypothetical protein
MRALLSLSILLAIASPLPAVKLPTVEAALAAAIAYRDPQGLWGQQSWTLTLREDRTDGQGRHTRLTFDPAAGRFAWWTAVPGQVREGILEGGDCTLKLDGSDQVPEAARQRFGLTCDRIRWLRDYYGYLWGLPMKLRDAGVLLSPRTAATDFRGQPSLRLQVRYEPPVGSDRWSFFLDPATYRLLGARFHHGEVESDGEEIVFGGEIEAGGVRFPKSMSWYDNADGRLLGTDHLQKVEVAAAQ